MKYEIKNKLGKIASLWKDFIWEYKFCSSKIKFNDDVKTNYLGTILGYFLDTLDLAFSTNRPSNNSDKFSFSISLLQAIYIHQDFIEELLEIFKTGINKGVLKKDQSYSINRELRNELIGHPVRKFEGKLISSTLFSYQAKQDEIQYLIYHKDNNFGFESKTFEIIEIQKRHYEFLEKYLDIILSKLDLILNEFLHELDKVETVKKSKSFDTLLKLVELYFESIFKSDFTYDKLSLLKIYNRRNVHLRYQNFIDCFYDDLKDYLTDTRQHLVDIFERKPFNDAGLQEFIPPEIEFVTTADHSQNEHVHINRDYNYEIGKIATKRNSQDFEFFGGLLRSELHENQLIIDELDHMQQNICNEIEYYTSLKLITKNLEKH